MLFYSVELFLLEFSCYYEVFGESFNSNIQLLLVVLVIAVVTFAA